MPNYPKSWNELWEKSVQKFEYQLNGYFRIFIFSHDKYHIQ